MAKELVQRILQQYGLRPVRLHHAQKGYRNESYAAELADNRTLNLIIYKREPGIVQKIRSANYVSDFLAEQGVPARHTADPRIIRLGADKYAALYAYLPGTTIPWEAYTMKHIKELGRAMSDMHAVLQALPQQDMPLVVNECGALLERMQRYFAENGVQRALANKLDLGVTDVSRFHATLTQANKLPAQALHMDFVRGNILFDEQTHITGILDFEKAAWGAPMFDIARTLAFLLVDCKYKDEAKIRKYFLQSGYNKRGQSSFAPSGIFEQLVEFFLVHDFYKFLCHNPYESLEQNEHFIRTRGFLLKRNILSAAKVLH